MARRVRAGLAGTLLSACESTPEDRDVVALLVSALKVPCVREDRNDGRGGEGRA